MSRRLGDDPLARKRGKGNTVVVTQAAESVSYNKVFFQRRPDNIDEAPTTIAAADMVQETVSRPETTISAEHVPEVAQPVAAEETAPVGWTAQLVESVAATSPAPVTAAPVPVEAVAPQPQNEGQQGGFFKRLFGRLQR